MDENRIIELLVKKACQQINESESKELELLLAQNPDATYYETFVTELWKLPKRKPHSNEMFNKHLERHASALTFEDAEPPGLKPSRRVFLTRILTAAAVVVVTTIGYLLLNQYTHIGKRNESIEVIATKGVKKQISLPDGTRVWLNSGSKLSYSVNFAQEKNRAVRLEGEAFFDVVKDKSRPFKISTNKITIKVLGTSFNVKAYPEERKTETTLISGEIELSVNERPGEKIRMKPSEKVAVISNRSENSNQTTPHNRSTVTIGSLSKVQIADKVYIQEASWIANKLIFKEEPLKELIPKLERWFNVNIVIENKALGDYKYTGSITEESLTQTLDALQLINSFNYKLVADEVTIY